MEAKYQLLTPMKVGVHTLKNRIVMPPMEARLNSPEGSPTQRMIDYYEARAKNGVGMIVVENTFIDNLESRSSVASSGLYSDHLIAQKAYLAEAIKKHGCVAVIQLSHGGRQANEAATGLECVAPSAIPCKVTNRMPRVLTIPEIERIEDDFAKAALRAKKAGFDGVEIHGAHGYLISEFLSPYANKRIDKYGGDLEGRGRMARNVIRKTRELVGSDFVVGFRISVDDFIKGAQTIEESCKFVKSIQQDIDYVHCSAGNYETVPICQVLTMYQPAGKIVHLAAAMKKAVDVPVIAVGALDAKLGDKVLQDDNADLIAFGRQLIADEEFAKKLYEDRIEDIRPCCRANEGCSSGFDIGYPMRCEVNPLVGREKEYQIKKTCNPKNIVIVGGGCAGLEAARVCDLMGHNVTLFEKSDVLGGHLVEAGIPPFKDKTKEVLDWQIRQVLKGGTCIKTAKAATPEDILAQKPDAVIVAVGSEYMSPPIEGVENTMYADEVLFNNDKAKQRTVVIGGGLVGIETAMTLAENKGIKTTVVEMKDELATEIDGIPKAALDVRVAEDDIDVRLSHKVTKIDKNGVTCLDKDNREAFIEADTVVLATGLIALEKERVKFEDLSVPTFFIGDCVKARTMSICFSEAWKAAFSI